MRKLRQQQQITDRQWAREQVSLWDQARKTVDQQLVPGLISSSRQGRTYLNPMALLLQAGTRLGLDQARQLAGLPGLLLVDGRKNTLTGPVTTCLREGRTLSEFFQLAQAMRWGENLQAREVFRPGYLMRRIVEVVQGMVITQNNCGTTEGILLPEGWWGRVTAEAVHHPTTGQLLVEAGRLLLEPAVAALRQAGVRQVRLRSPITCQSLHGLCRWCYGLDLSQHRLVEEGTAVGVLAAQSVGQVATQATLDAYRSAGAANFRGVFFTLRKIEALLEVASRAPEGRIEAVRQRRRRFAAPPTSLPLSPAPRRPGRQASGGDPVPTGVLGGGG